MKPPYIYRNFSLERTSVTAAGKFIQALVLSGGSITDVGSLVNGFPPEKVQYYSSFFRLRFWKQEQLDKFHSFGFKTDDIEQVSLGGGLEPDRPSSQGQEEGLSERSL
jgi:hypothetical protein